MRLKLMWYHTHPYILIKIPLLLQINSTAQLSHLNFSCSYFFFFFFLFWLPHGIWRVPGPEQSCSYNLSCSCRNARSLTHCAGLGIKPASQYSQDAANPLRHSRNSPLFLLLSPQRSLALWSTPSNISSFLSLPQQLLHPETPLKYKCEHCLQVKNKLLKTLLKIWPKSFSGILTHPSPPGGTPTYVWGQLSHSHFVQS